MRKITFFILCFLKLYSYNLEFYYNYSLDASGEVSGSAIYRFFTDSNGNLIVRFTRRGSNGITTGLQTTDGYFYNYLNYIRKHAEYFIDSSQLNSYFHDDHKFLNDMYVKRINPILNYYYNPNSFNSSSYVNFYDYTLLYDSDGYAVESIVGGVWAGLYSDSEKSISGKLYDVSGNLLYVNGERVSFFEVFFYKVFDSIEGTLSSAVALASRPVGVIAVSVFVLGVLSFVVSVGVSALKVRHGSQDTL